MRNLTPLLICLCLLISATTTMAGRMADSLAFQGRLTDASDNPVPDGPRDLTLSLWTDPVGGTMLHSEVVVVTVSKGLYSTCIGCTSSSFFDIFTDQSVYLQVQLAGSPPMTPRTTLRSVPFSVSSSGVHGEATNGAARGRGIISVKSATGSGSMTNGKFLLDADSDGDGVAEASDSTGVSEVAAGRRLQVHNLGSSGEDGVEITATSASRRINVTNIGSSGQDGVEITATSAKHAINTKGTGGTRVASIESSTSDLVASSVCSMDLDGDGIPESSSFDAAHPVLCTKVITHSSGSTTGTIRMVATTDSTSSAVDHDSDGDGIPESEISQLVTPTTSGVAIKVKGTGAENNRVITTATPDSVVTEQTFAFTNSLLMPALMKAKEKANRTKCSNNLRYQSPIANNEAEFAVDSASSGLTMSADSDGDGIEDAVVSTSSGVAEVGGIPGGVIAARVAIKTKGTGADPNRSSVSSSSSPSRSSVVCDQDSDGDGLADRSVTMDCDDTDGGITVAGASSAVKIKHKGWDGLIYGRMAIETGGAIEVDFGGNGVGFVSQRFGVGVLSPTHPFEHSSGAHLTAGGVWTNASDENLKENFQPVDGAELLEKIEELPISQWNYKSESDEVTHIGPTAQDFQKVFGVGENDKTISTIDPSGIALAAIKELNQQNQELREQSQDLKAQNELLKKRLNDLTAKVEKLISNK